MKTLESEALFQLVVVGSSAGGIEALSKLVASLPNPFQVPLVIAQHLDPKRLSHLAEILRRHTSLSVVSVDVQELLKPGTIYVVPSNHHVEITDHDVTLLPDGDGRPTPSVNLLLSSAAEVYGEKLIAVILTGTGTDGTAGARIVHEREGTVIIQNPATAAYPGMPQSIAPETVDFVADLSNIGSILGDLISGKPIISSKIDIKSELGPFLAQVREQTEIDFSTYKPATLIRRLQRRLVATDSPDLASYGRYLQVNPSEYEHLVADFLIKVTEFMRDADLFSYLQTQVLPKIIEHSRLHNDKELRFWSAGCATGEEAYSLAILLSELLGPELAEFNIKIFATDLDSEAIAFARKGFYSTKALANLPPGIVERYFVTNSAKSGYEVKKQVRSLVVFGENDLGQRAPFPRIDMVLCRNVLIYFNRALQEHALQLFAFALRDEGYLVLGRAETVSPLTEFFEVLEPQQRVYQRQGVRRLNPPFGLQNVIPTPTSTPKNGHQARKSTALVERSLFQMQEEARANRGARDNLLLKLPVGVVVVDAHFDIQEINSAARRLLSIHTVAIGEDFIHLSQNIPPRELSAAITRTIREDSVSSLNPVEVPHLITGEATFLQLSCYPHPGLDHLTEENHTGGGEGGEQAKKGEYVLIIITDLTKQIVAQRELRQDNSQQAKLVAELSQRIATLERINAELQKSNQELHQTNSALSETKLIEITSLNQELKRLNDEQTEAKHQLQEVVQAHTHQMQGLVEANQELLAANEEVTTQNAALRTDNEEYLLHTEEAQAAIEEADTLNEEMQATNEELETLNEELQATVEELNTTNSDLVVQGLELRERSEELKVQQQRSEQEGAQLNAILSSMADALVVVNNEGKVLLTNLAYQQAFGEGKPEITLLDEVDEQPIPAEATPQARAARGETFNMTFSFRVADGGRHWWEASGQPVRAEAMPDWGMVVMRDITERSLRRLQEQLFSQIAHELRTPLTIIKARNDLAADWLGKQEGDFEKPLKHIRQALQYVNNLEHLISDMVDTTRLGSGKFRMYFSPVRLDSLLEELVAAAQTLTNKQVVELSIDSQALSVQGDPLRLQQVVLNLIGNAITYAPSSPKIVVGLRQVAKEQVEIYVQDYGPGIKAEHLGDIFSRYYQVMHDSSFSNKGLGLGLFISQQIVEGHGGTIRVESTEGEGTTFIVKLPLLMIKEKALS